MKVSQELVKLRRVLESIGSGSAGGTNMKLIELEQADGDPAFVNPKDGVAWLEPRGVDKTRVHFTGGSSTVVKGTPAEVAELLED